MCQVIGKRNQVIEKINQVIRKKLFIEIVSSLSKSNVNWLRKQKKIKINFYCVKWWGKGILVKQAEFFRVACLKKREEGESFNQRNSPDCLKCSCWKRILKHFCRVFVRKKKGYLSRGWLWKGFSMYFCARCFSWENLLIKGFVSSDWKKHLRFKRLR